VICGLPGGGKGICGICQREKGRERERVAGVHIALAKDDAGGADQVVS